MLFVASPLRLCRVVLLVFISVVQSPVGGGTILLLSQERSALENGIQLKTLAEMTTYYEHRLRLDPNDAKARVRLGFAQSSLGKRAAAIEQFERAIELDPRDDEAHLHLGLIWLNQARYAQAQSEFETALRLNPNNYLAHGNLGLLHMNQGHWQAAETHLRSALQLNPADAVAQENLKSVLAAKATSR